jgi:hypothetical protein
LVVAMEHMHHGRTIRCWWYQLYFLNVTRWDSKHRVMRQEKFSPQGWLQGLYQTVGKNRWLFLHKLQTTYYIRTLVLCPQITVLFVRHQQLASSQNQKELVTSIFCYCCV